MDVQKILVEVDGKTHRGSYSINKGTITVTDGLISKSTQIGGSWKNPVSLATIMLQEIVKGRGSICQA